MRSFYHFLFLFYWFILGPFPGLYAQESPPSQAIVGVRLVLEPSSGPVTLLLKDGQIHEIISGEVRPEGYTLHEFPGSFVIPGLVDLASRCQDITCLGHKLAWGVTTVRTLEPLPKDMEGLLPRVVRAARVGSPRQWEQGFGIEELADIPPLLTKLQAEEVQWVLPEPSLLQNLQMPLMHQARSRGFKIGGRPAQANLGAWLQERPASLEHATSTLFPLLELRPLALLKGGLELFHRYVVPQMVLVDLEALQSQGVPDRLWNVGLVLVPGLSLLEEPREQEPPGKATLAASLQRPSDRFGSSTHTTNQAFAKVAGWIMRLAEKGIPLGVGTWAPAPLQVPGFSAHREMEIFVAQGWSPLQALNAGTRTGAELLGLPGRGRLEVGAPADFLVLKSNPLEAIQATQDLQAIFVRGEFLEPGTGAKRPKMVLGRPWTSMVLDGFDDMELEDEPLMRWKRSPEKETYSQKVMVLPMPDGGCLRLTGRAIPGKPEGIWLNLLEESRRPLSFSSFRGVSLRARGTGLPIQLEVHTVRSKEEGGSFVTSFIPGQEWKVIQLPWSAFRRVGPGPTTELDARDVVSFSLQTRPGTQEELFQLDLDSFGFFD